MMWVCVNSSPFLLSFSYDVASPSTCREETAMLRVQLIKQSLPVQGLGGYPAYRCWALYLSVMINFMCRCDWASGCPNIWSSIILGVSFEGTCEWINIWINRLSKLDCPPLSRWASPNQLKAKLDEKVQEERMHSLGLSSSWDIYHLLP